MNKKIIGIVVAVVLVIGGIAGGITYASYQKKITKEYDGYAKQVEVAKATAPYCIDDVSKYTKTLTSLEKGMKNKSLTDKEKKDLKNACASIEKSHKDSKKTCDESYKRTTKLYDEDAHSELYAFSDEFNEKYNAELKKYDTAYKKTDYKTADDIITNLYGDIVEWQKEKEAEAEEKQKAEEEARAQAKKQEQTTTSTNNSSNGSNNTTYGRVPDDEFVSVNGTVVRKYDDMWYWEGLETPPEIENLKPGETLIHGVVVETQPNGEGVQVQ